MPLVGTISGSNGTTTSSVTGSLIISNNTAAQFPSIASDTILYVSGVINGTSKAVIGGDLVVSGTTNLKGNLVLSGTNVLLGGNVTFNSDILYLDKTNARVGIGTSSPDSDLTVKTSNSNNIRGVLGVHYDNTTAFSQFKFIGSRARGSVGSPAAVQANDSLASFNGRGYKQNSWSDTVGGLYIYAKQNWTNTDTPTYITLRGVAQGAGNAVNEWARLDNSEFVVTGTVVASGTLKSLNSSADDGGEIFLNKPVTNTTLNTGLTIDVYQNKLRIFEAGGTNRGGYWDVSTLLASAGTNLTPTPAGSDTYVQFNDSGVFNGTNNLKFAKTTGTLSVANLIVTGTVAGSFVSSGSILVKDIAGTANVTLNTNGDITGSNLLLNGDIAVVGGDITTNSSVFNLLTGSITTLSIGGLATNNVFAGNVSIAGLTTLSTIAEKISTSNGGSSTVNFDTAAQSIFYVKGPAGDITANFTTVSTTNNRVITPTVILSQSATARIITAVQIDSSPVTINWANGVTPAGVANKHDAFGFSLIRSGSAWTVLGQMSTYG